MVHRSVDHRSRPRQLELRSLSNIMEFNRNVALLDSPSRLQSPQPRWTLGVDPDSASTKPSGPGQGRKTRSASVKDWRLTDASRDTLEGPVKNADPLEEQAASVPLSASLYGDYSFIYDLYPVRHADSVEEEAKSVPLSASLYGDYSFIYDLYLE